MSGHSRDRSGALTRGREGSTLIELLIVLVVLALLTGLVTPALTAVPEVDASDAETRVRLSAVRSGVTIVTDSLVALPDGRVIRRKGER